MAKQKSHPALVGALVVAIAALAGWQLYNLRQYLGRKQPQIDIAALERRIHALTNEQRRKHGIPELQFDDRLAKVARAHSQDMSNRNFFQHINLEGEDPGARGKKLGYRCVKNYDTYYTEGLSENLMRTYLYDSVLERAGIVVGYDWRTPEEIAQISVDGWMNSPGHRRTLLTATYDREGIGVTISPHQEVYVTQNFC
ncbi:CAP domain-containing protein [Pseudanabaena sp. PCC 6802]|uniref:CAP domain-containing protein n=1 Tax=Pseudanabaena sp. PCC 6802 TaxID=118173 RepID=UPI00034D6AAD|nr:CAP domain-containing protein [Pseudanabaena sp. PCC 6802]